MTEPKPDNPLKGKAKFILDGAHFKEIGESYDYQNPIYLVRKLPENVYRLDGTQAFPGWTGGWLGVALKEMEQHNEMHKEWYIQD